MRSLGSRRGSHDCVPRVGMSPKASSRQSISSSARSKVCGWLRKTSKTLSRPGYWERYSAAMSFVRSAE